MKREYNRRNCRKQGSKRLNTHVQGGNWQGMPYLSYMEWDRITRQVLATPDPMFSNKMRRETLGEGRGFESRSIHS